MSLLNYTLYNPYDNQPSAEYKSFCESLGLELFGNNTPKTYKHYNDLYDAFLEMAPEFANDLYNANLECGPDDEPASMENYFLGFLRRQGVAAPITIANHYLNTPWLKIKVVEVFVDEDELPF